MTQPVDAQPRRPVPKSAWREARELAAVLVGALILSTVFRVVACQPFTIPSSSMEPGLVTGDYIIVSKFAYGWSRASLPLGAPTGDGRLLGRTPARGDVVVFRLPRNPREVWIKRVIGLPGDTVQVRAGVVRINGRPIEQAALGLTADIDAPDRQVMAVREVLADGSSWITYDGGPGPGDDTPAFRVPPGHYFMMGDNRDNSLDSRWPQSEGVGLLPEANIVGRAELVTMSWKPGASLFRPWTWAKLRPDRFLVPIRQS